MLCINFVIQRLLFVYKSRYINFTLPLNVTAIDIPLFATYSRTYTKQNLPRFSPINIQMLSHSLHRQIFGQDVKPSDEAVQRSIEHLKENGLWDKETQLLPDVDLELPKLYGETIEDHFYHLGCRFSAVYRVLLDKLITTNIPPKPKEWKLAPGWTQYNASGESKAVDFPMEPGLVFDVEVCLQEGNYPTLATAVSQEAWYCWCSERLVQDTFSWSQGISLEDLIPLETASHRVKPINHEWTPRLVIGHNVSFDRTYVKEQYFFEGTKLRFLDTLSLHMCVSGLTGLQRAMSVAKKSRQSKKSQQENELSLDWMDISSLNNLPDVYALYCNGILKKDPREVFISGSLDDVRERFQELATYCSQDVVATYEILQMLLPLFFKRFPHPVTFMGMLEMSTAFLPVNHNWDHYLQEAQSTYEDIQKELKLSLIHLADDACSLLHNHRYKEDPWLWDLNWSVRGLKYKKEKEPVKKGKNKNLIKELSDGIDSVSSEHSILEDEDEDSTMENAFDEHVKDLFSTSANLHKVLPFLPGYPLWYRELCVKPEDGNLNWEPGPILISTQVRSVPKLMRLTWDGFPLHYDCKHGWGYLVPGRPQDQINDDEQTFPLERLLELCSFPASEKHTGHSEIDEAWLQLLNLKENHNETRLQWKIILQNEANKLAKNSHFHSGNGPYEDVYIRGCWFFRLPHKDGPHKRVGNPLSKDFLVKVTDGTLQAHGGGKADRALGLSKMVSYWKNANKRIMSQMVVWLNNNELPLAVIRHTDYDDEGLYGAILPRLITAGTVTRRAVEPTWMTASNAYPDRVGSELKSLIQAPPGYHFVGADVDSQELWIAAILGDANFAGIHGSTAFGWMTLQGKKSEGTDMHSRTASSVNISRDQAKIINYGRIYGAGRSFAQRLLMQFNHRLTPEEAMKRAKKMYAETKGIRKNKFNSEDENQEVIIYNYEQGPLKKVWMGGSESQMFNKLEEIADGKEPRTPVLGCQMSRALEPKTVNQSFMTSRVNWVVQSSAVDYLHLMLISMKWLMEDYNINGRYSISIHDEVHYLVESGARYRAALALQITNLLTRSLFAYKLGMHDLPQSVAFFSSIDIDTVLRKEVTMDCKTPSNPHGLEKGYGISPGVALDIHQIIEKTNGSLNERQSF